MSREGIVAACAAAGLPCVHMAWPAGSAPPLPWCAFYLDGSSGFCADGAVYAPARSWTLELYQRSRDAAIESALEREIAARFGPFSKSEAWVEREGCLQTAYGFTSIERDGE